MKILDRTSLRLHINIISKPVSNLCFFFIYDKSIYFLLFP